MAKKQKAVAPTEIVTIKPSEWVQRHLYIEGAPFRFMSDYGPRNHLIPIYDSSANHILLKTARGCEKSTTLCNKIVERSCTTSGYKTLYVNPSPQQITDFVVQQLNPRLRSPWVKKHRLDKGCIDNIMLKNFTNDSIVFLRNVLLSPDRTRGIRAYSLMVDEIQDMLYKNLPVIEETLFSSQKIQKMKTYAGTPKTYDNAIQWLWEKSSQYMWHSKCWACGEWNTWDSVKNIGKTGPICIKCGKKMQPAYGRWIAMNPGADIDGYHFNQIMLPWTYNDPTVWKSVLLKMEMYGGAEFHNEVLGVSYDNADKPITEAEMRRCCTGIYHQHPTLQHLRMPTFMGIDWGTGSSSKTVAVIGAFVDGKLRILHFKEFPPFLYPTQDNIVDEILRLVDEWRVIRVASDWGFGVVQNQRLRSALGDDVLFEFYNSASLKGMVKWGQIDGKYTINHVATMASMFNDIKDVKVEFPSGPEIDAYVRHFLNVHTEYSTHTRKMLYQNGPESPDDYCHATNYMRIMSQIYYGTIDVMRGA